MASPFSITKPKVGMYTPPTDIQNKKQIMQSSPDVISSAFEGLSSCTTSNSNNNPAEQQQSLSSLSDKISLAFEGLSSSDKISSAFEDLSMKNNNDKSNSSSLQVTSSTKSSSAISSAFDGLPNDELQIQQQHPSNPEIYHIDNINSLQTSKTTTTPIINQSSDNKISSAFENLSLKNEQQQEQQNQTHQRSKSDIIRYDDDNNITASSSLSALQLKDIMSNTADNNNEQHQRSKSEIIHSTNDDDESKLSKELKHLSTELSCFFKEEKQKQELQLQIRQEEERKEKIDKEVKKSFVKEGERQDRLSTLGLTPKASKKVVSATGSREENRRHNMLNGISPKTIQKKVISLSKSKLQNVKNERIATRTKHRPETLMIEGPAKTITTKADTTTSTSGVIPPPPSSTPPQSLSSMHKNTNKTQQPSPSSNAGCTTSEQEPSVHQIELSSVDEIYLTAKLCTFMEDYRKVDQNFDLSSLLHTHVACTNVANNPTQKPIINSILDFGVEDIILQGFFILDDDTDSKDCYHRMECVIFSSEVKRKFYVCFRGDNDQQKKPIRNREKHTSASKAKVLHTTQSNIKIHPSFHDSYYKRSNKIIEEQVFTSIQQLVESNPFFDIVFTGYSYGAGLALLSSVRYSHLYSMMRVYCTVYSCPKVGCGVSGINFRDFVHSLSNLKVQRIEYGSDPFVNLPEGSTTWVHAGHSIKISSKTENNNSHPPKAYKFDKHRPHPNSIELIVRQRIFGGKSIKKNKKQDESSNDIHSYVHVLEKFSCRGLSWVKSFVGEDGKGVAGKNNEKRLLV